MWPRPEAEVVFTAKLCALATTADVLVLVLCEVSTHREDVVRVVGGPGHVAGRAVLHFTLVKTLSKLADHEFFTGIRLRVRIFVALGVVHGEPEVGELRFVLATGASALAATDIVGLTSVKVTDYYCHASIELV